MKKCILSLKGPREASLHVPRKRGPCGDRRPFPVPYLAYLLVSPVKEPLLQFPLAELPQRERERERERDVPFLEPSFTYLSKSPVYESPSRFPSGTPIERNARLQSHCYISSRVPSDAVPPPGSPHRAPIERDDPFPEPSFNYQFTVNGFSPPPPPSQRGPFGGGGPFPEPSSTHKSPVD